LPITRSHRCTHLAYVACYKTINCSIVYMDKARGYIGLASYEMMVGDQTCKHKEGLLKGIMWLKVALIKYPYLDDDIRKVLIDRGNLHPTEAEIDQSMLYAQPLKDKIEGRINTLSQFALLKKELTQDEIDQTDLMAMGWLKANP